MKMKKRIEIAKSWESKRWTPMKLRTMWVLWQLYKRLPGKSKVEFNLPGPTSTSHPFGAFTPFRKGDISND